MESDLSHEGGHLNVLADRFQESFVHPEAAGIILSDMKTACGSLCEPYYSLTSFPLSNVCSGSFPSPVVDSH